MDQKDLDEIGRFLATTRTSTLFEYFGVDQDASGSAVELALKKKRAWAQGQQANPKYRAEAMWVIKNLRLAKQALLDDRDTYRSAVSSRDQEKNLEVLNLFIMGTLADGLLTAKGEEAVRDQALRMGLDEATVTARIDALLAEHDAVREDDAEGRAPSEEEEEPFIDYYAALDARPDADQETLVEAYRARYRWARSLADKRKAAEVYKELDSAWRVLKDKSRRQAYDARYRKHNQHQETPSPPEPTMYLPPPPSARQPEAPRVSAPPTRDFDEEPPSTPSSHGLRFRADGGLPPSDPVPPPQRPRRAPGLNEDATLERTFSSGVEEDAPPPRMPASVAAAGTRLPEPPSEPLRGPPTAPRPPDSLAGRTLGLGQDGQTSMPPRAAPNLEIVGPDTVRVSLRRQPRTVRITVRNTGTAPMPGRVFSDRDWLEAAPARLDPALAEQVVEATVFPRMMPRSRAAGLVTIVGDHGERRAVTIEAERNSGLWLYALLLLLLAGAAGTAALALGLLTLGQASPPPPSGALEIRTDLGAGEIYVNGKLVSSTGAADIDKALPLGQPVPLRVELNGFQTWTDEVVFEEGEPVTRTPVLELVDPMIFEPSGSDRKVDLDLSRVATVLEERRSFLERCFLEHLDKRPGSEARLKITAYVTSRGYVEGLHLDEQNYDSPEVDRCLRRQLRAVRWSPMLHGDYGSFQQTLAFDLPASGTP